MAAAGDGGPGEGEGHAPVEDVLPPPTGTPSHFIVNRPPMQLCQPGCHARWKPETLPTRVVVSLFPHHKTAACQACMRGAAHGGTLCHLARAAFVLPLAPDMHASAHCCRVY